ncbi:MAG: hypothetical protein LBR88_09715 [Zoogloeaceae bacterium]|jgi:organic radical activating enzyme|nr:hypothetical protein [Zoogloeaceae bacterium]
MKTEIESMLEQTSLGEHDFRAEIMAYINGFSHVILRGGGGFGRVIGKFLLEIGVDRNKLCYWDIRAGELREINGIPVLSPLSENLDREQTLAINCLNNHAALGARIWDRVLVSEKHQHYIQGMDLFSALICKIKSRLETRGCFNICERSNCKRLLGIVVKKKPHSGSGVVPDRLVFPSMAFIINQKCTLQCAHCNQYMNHFPEEGSIHFSLQQIIQDIDVVSDALDAILSVSIVGGEPFLHPDLPEIIEHMSSKNNFGPLTIGSNGVCKISGACLKVMEKLNVQVRFSDYRVSINEKQKKLFDANVRKLSTRGISHFVASVAWSLPSTLTAQHHSEQHKIQLKKNCPGLGLCERVANGVYYPCPVSCTVDSLHLADYGSDKVILDPRCSPEEMREKIRAVQAAPFYQCCDYCGEKDRAALPQPGEQGISLRYAHLGNKKRLPSSLL